MMAATIRAGAAMVAALAAAMSLAQGPAAGPQFPSRPMRMIVPFAPGGSTDVLARLVSQRLTESLGQQVVVDNRSGAGGNIGMALAAKATPDGHVMVLVSSSFVVNPGLYKQVPYYALKDFAAVSYVASAPSMLVVHPSVAARSVKDLVAAVKAAGGKFNYASPGPGTAQHLAGELFKVAAGIDASHVPYNGAGPAVAAVLGAQVQMGFASLPAVQTHVAAGTLRAIAITTLKRSPVAADVPTFDESGYKGFEVDHLQGVLVPAGTPRPIVERLSAEIRRAIDSPEVKPRLAALGFEPVGNTPDAFAKQIREQLPKWEKLVRQAGIRVD
jgi:tripartite-type tricarboxylate transporter receptor subunit TctC